MFHSAPSRYFQGAGRSQSPFSKGFTVDEFLNEKFAPVNHRSDTAYAW